MLASAFAVGAPSVLPKAAAANANLFVSAENAQFQNYFTGPQVIEVVVIDSDIKDTNVGKGEPDVTVNGNKLRMIQATDGNWYGYFADRDSAEKADSIQAAMGTTGYGVGLDFGSFCSASTAENWIGFTLTQTQGVAIPITGQTVKANTDGNIAGGTITTDCSHVYGGVGAIITGSGVVREAKTPNSVITPKAQIGLNYTGSSFAGKWPFIQLYTFNPTGNVIVQYNKGGGIQSTTLKFDTSDQFAKLEFDRSVYPQGAQVQSTMTDVQLNIDPTDEDSWTFSTTPTAPSIYYNIFNEDGTYHVNSAGDGAISTELYGNLTKLMFDHNGVLKMDPAAQTTSVIQIQQNADNILIGGVIPGANLQNIGNQPVTFTETAPNTGVFGTYDENDKSVLTVDNTVANRGKSATFDFNQKKQSVVVGFGSATVDIQPTDAEWNSGEKIPITVVDSDANKNSRGDEDLKLKDPNVSLIPSLRIGTPFTLGIKNTEVQTPNANGIVSLEALYLDNFTASGVTNDFTTLKSQIHVHNTFTTGYGATAKVQKYSDRALVTPNNATNASVTALILDTGATAQDLQKSIFDPRVTSTTKFHGFNLVNVDVRGISSNINKVTVALANTTNTFGLIRNSNNNANNYEIVNGGSTMATLVTDVSPQSLNLMNTTFSATLYPLLFDDQGPNSMGGGPTLNKIGYVLNFTRVNVDSTITAPVVVDLFSYGYKNDGVAKADRINNAIYRIEVEETGDNTSTFAGTLEYVMLNQLNILDKQTYLNQRTISNQVKFVVNENLDAQEAPRVNYNDLGSDGVVTQVSDQQDAPTHSGVASFDKPTYKKADTVVVTVDDQDLNTSPGLIDIYTVVTTPTTDPAYGQIGKENLPRLSNNDPLGSLLYITFDDQKWIPPTVGSACDIALVNAGVNRGLDDAGFTLVETGSATGIFTGTFEVPASVCALKTNNALTAPAPAMGLNMEVKYNDFRDASGQITRVGDAAGIRANTGSVSLDRTVYPLPWGSVADFITPTDDTEPNGRSIFPVHLTAITDKTNPGNGLIGDATTGKTLAAGKLTVHIQVNDPDYDTSASGEDKIAENTTSTTGITNRGPVKVSVSRGSSSVILAYAGGDTSVNGVIDVIGTDQANNATYTAIRQIGPITETTPSSGIFEFPMTIEYTDGPASSLCPTTIEYDSLTKPGTRSADLHSRFDTSALATSKYCILQGDIITVEYTDPTDASGKVNTVTDSATFDLRNGALQSDKSVYIIGSDMILTLIEPDFDLDNQNAETYDLDLIEWDSDAATITLGNLGGAANVASFDAEPSDFRETGDSTGIFQSVVKIPEQLNSKKLNRGEEVVLEYTDWGPSGADYVGQENEKVNLTIFTSNFGATVELDQKVYTWTDKVYITVVAPDHNFDSNLIDTIGTSNKDPLKVATRAAKLDKYQLTETGTDTGIFTGEVILVGFDHDANGAVQNGGKPSFNLSATGNGPTGGYLGASNSDGVSVSYEFSEDETVVGSALVRWNIGEVSWLEASYPASGTGVVRVVDPDMNLNPEAVDNFDVNVWSDSDAGGIDLTVTETNEATGIFEGTVFFTTTDDSSGHRLRVAEGDTVTAEYKDNTLPDPYTVSDELDITATSFIGTVVPPLERAPASNPRVVDAFGNTLDSVSVDQQVQITADLTNGQDREQPFAYLVQVQDDNGVTVSLAWITGSLSAGQSFSPALSWVPSTSGQYTATVFVWESVDNPTALSPPESVDITVS